MKYFSLFSGIGGFELGIKQAYVESINRKKNRRGEGNSQGDDAKGQRLVSKKRQATPGQRRWNGELPDWELYEGAPACVGFSEIDKYATAIYQNHFPNHKNYGDIKTINEQELPDFEILVGGFPCQSFSIAGRRGGFADTRGTLFFDIARIAKAKQPRLLLLENVKGLLSHDEGRTFATIIATLDELGYDLQWQVLNSKDFGVPQNRERVYIVGHLRGTPRPEVFPIQGGNAKTIETLNGAVHQDYRVYDQEGVSPTLNANRGGGSAKHPFIISKTVRAGGRASPHGSKQNWDSYEVDGKIRRLTPTECERLQGFPDGWTKTGVDYNYDIQGEISDGAWIPMSDSQRYKTLGNAVTVNVICAIAKRMVL